MKLGFTGTRFGLMDPQRETVAGLIAVLFSPEEFHHGACNGADAEVADLCYILRQSVSKLKDMKIVAHPGRSAREAKIQLETSNQTALQVSDQIRILNTHFARNRCIVDETDALLATPKEDYPMPTGGTWYTVDYATNRGKPVYIVYQSGKIERRNVH